MKLSKYLSTQEVACRCGCGFGEQLMDTNMGVVKLFDLIREAVGHPLHIGSGCRCASRNELVGGAPNSAHLRGTALDISCGTGQQRYNLIIAAVLAALVVQGKLQENEMAPMLANVSETLRGLGVDSRFVHIDVDHEVPRPAAWTYGKERRFV